MNHELKIEDAVEEDLEKILSLQKQCYLPEAAIYNDYSIPPLKQTIASVKDEYQNGTIFLKGIINNMLVASVRGIVNDDTAYIGKLIVSKEFQNKQIGQKMMNAIEQNLNHCARYELFTGHKSEKNIYLYNKLGYSEYKREVMNDKLTLVFMHKQIH